MSPKQPFRVELDRQQVRQQLTRVLRLAGLDPNASYSIQNDTADSPGQILSGRTLMDVGMPWPIFGDYNCAILRLQKK